jgi:hypothetical protein
MWTLFSYPVVDQTVDPPALLGFTRRKATAERWLKPAESRIWTHVTTGAEVKPMAPELIEALQGPGSERAKSIGLGWYNSYYYYD